MYIKKFYIPYKEDERMLYAAQYFEKNGLTQTVDRDAADFVLLPVPVKKYMLEGLENCTVFYGAGDKADFGGFDYNKEETFLLKNAYMTAEGAVALYKEKSGTALYNAKVLIAGYGRIAKALHRALNAFGSDVTVCLRNPAQRTLAQANGAEVIGFDELSQKRYFDVIFNTVPKVVFTKPEIDAVCGDALFIDLASFPGGIDMHYAAHKKINVIDGRGLPSKYSVKSAGYLIGETVLCMAREVSV